MSTPPVTVADLARRARVHTDRCWTIFGDRPKGRPRRGTTLDVLRSAAKSKPELAAELARAQELWWAMASTLKRVVGAEVRRFKHAGRRFSQEPCDLEQWAWLGAIRAAETWEPDRPGAASFSTYGGRGIRHFLMASFNRSGGTVHIPWQKRLAVHELKLAVAEAGSIAAGAALLGMSNEEASALCAADGIAVPLDGFDADSEAEDLDERIDRYQRDSRAAGALLQMGHRSRAIAVGKLQGQSLTQIGAQVGLSSERVRQLAPEAMAEFRSLCR